MTEECFESSTVYLLVAFGEAFSDLIKYERV